MLSVRADIWRRSRRNAPRRTLQVSRRMPSARSRYFAFDLGAESGRAILGELRSGILEVREVCRFPNQPVHERGSLRWDILRLWLEMQRALDRVPFSRLDGIGVDTWGVDYALIGE